MSTDNGGAYMWIPTDRETSVETEVTNKKARRGRPRHRPSSWLRAEERARREEQVREQQASLVEPVEVANSSQSTRDEGSMSRNPAECAFFKFRER